MRRYSISSEKYFILIISVIFILLTFFVIKDVFALIIYAMIISYFVSPLYNYYNDKLNNKRLSSLLTLITITLGLFIPILFLFYFLALSLFKIVLEYKIYIENPEILNDIFYEFLQKFTSSNDLASVDFSEIIRIIANYTIDFATNFMLSIPETIIYFFIVLFISYYLLIHSETIFKTVNEYIPLTLKKQNEIIRNITKNLRVLFRGYFLTGLIQTLIAAIIYVVLGAPNATILIFLTFIASLIPYIGTPLIWVPVGIFMIFTGNSFNGYMLIILGALIISTVDNFLRPILMSDKETVPPPLVFIGFVGGMLAFGIEGIILGPIIISITSILLRYVKEYYELKDRV